MSHFVTWVLAETGDVEVGGAESVCEVLLEPYDENIDVAEYDRPCRCGEWHAREEAARRVREENPDLLADVTIIRERLAAERTAAISSMDAEGVDANARTALMEELNARHRSTWETHGLPVIQRLNAAEEALFLANARKAQPIASCPECNGRGTYRSTYNPDSKWDWWQVGGRWGGEYDPTDSGRNVIPVAEILAAGIPDHAPCAVVTPDGAWHEVGEVGWFGMVNDAKSEAAWADEVAALLAAHPQRTLVVCDCHI